MKKILSLGLVGLSVFLLSACGGPSSDSNNKRDGVSSDIVEKAENKSSDGEKATFKDNVLENKDYKIEFKDNQVLDGYDGKKVLVVNYTYTNKSDKDRSPSSDLIFDTRMTQDAEKTTEQLYSGSLSFETSEANPEIEQKNEMATKDVKPQQTVECAYLVALVNDSPVKVSFKSNFQDIEGTKIIEVQ